MQNNQQGKVFGSWLVVKVPKEKVKSCLVVAVATRQRWCVFFWRVVTCSVVLMRGRAHTHASRLATLWETSRFQCWSRCIEYHWMSLFRMQSSEKNNHTRISTKWSQRFDRLQAVVVWQCCWIWGATLREVLPLFCVCVCVGVCVCVVCEKWGVNFPF